ncbi:hypothetical protein BDC45DRAFT_541782 [Circinella umbellata]|nr:hypothetical protein BDC45DRAFT_541782 [Circinella umbellata]
MIPQSSICINSMIILGLNMLPIVMDCPHRYVSRINCPACFYHYPTTAADFLTNTECIIHSIYDLKETITNSLNLISNIKKIQRFRLCRSVITPPSFRLAITKTEKEEERQVAI